MVMKFSLFREFRPIPEFFHNKEIFVVAEISNMKNKEVSQSTDFFLKLLFFSSFYSKLLDFTIIFAVPKIHK